MPLCFYSFIYIFFFNIKASCCDFGVRPARRTLKGLQGVAKWDAANRRTSLQGPEDAWGAVINPSGPGRSEVPPWGGPKELMQGGTFRTLLAGASHLKLGLWKEVFNWRVRIVFWRDTVVRRANKKRTTAHVLTLHSDENMQYLEVCILNSGWSHLQMMKNTCTMVHWPHGQCEGWSWEGRVSFGRLTKHNHNRDKWGNASTYFTWFCQVKTLCSDFPPGKRGTTALTRCSSPPFTPAE